MHDSRCTIATRLPEGFSLTPTHAPCLHRDLHVLVTVYLTMAAPTLTLSPR
jgi:hypothetical protein